MGAFLVSSGKRNMTIKKDTNQSIGSLQCLFAWRLTPISMTSTLSTDTFRDLTPFYIKPFFQPLWQKRQRKNETKARKCAVFQSNRTLFISEKLTTILLNSSRQECNKSRLLKRIIKYDRTGFQTRQNIDDFCQTLWSGNTGITYTTKPKTHAKYAKNCSAISR